MGTKSQHLQAMFARKREMEHMHTERTQAVHKYYDHWGKVNARFENWSTPEYYKQADGKLQKTKEAKEKEKTLESRRENLRQLLSHEKEKYDLEIKEKENLRKTKMHDLTTLEKLTEKLKEEHTLRRKLELNAKLYGRWRHGVDDDKLVFESKSDNAVIAKLNWLDKQVEKQMDREKDEQLAHARELRMQEELNRAEQLHKERQQIREVEIREIRSLQEMHMEQLKEKQSETSLLKDQEQKYRNTLDNLEKEIELLDESYTHLLQPADFGGAYNLTKIKVFMRKRSELYRNHIKLCVSILQRLSASLQKPDAVNALKEKLSKQLDSEMYQLTRIDAMYESEAKYNLQKCEELWKLESSERYKDLKEVLNDVQIAEKKRLHDVMMQQNELIDIRSAHLNAIESTSEKLKQLIKEEEDSPRSCTYANREAIVDEPKKSVTFSPSPRGNDVASPQNSARSIPELNLSTVPADSLARDTHRGRGFYNHTYDAPTDGLHVTNSFNHLNLDVWENDTGSNRDSNTVRLGGQRSLQVVTSDNAAPPKFGRKRVAWT